MKDQHLRIATRKSPLALWQANHVADQLRRQHPGLKVSLLEMTTAGDRFLDGPLSAAGGKGLFIKELEQSLIDGRADMAVHSMKDVTIDLPDGLAISVLLRREDPRDALVAPPGTTLAGLPAGARVGTSSLRRQSQLRGLRPDIEVTDLRGNVGTRLAKLDRGEYDAIMLAAAGVKRLELSDRVSEYIAADTMLPAVGQGVIGVETRRNDPVVTSLIESLNDPGAEICLAAERAISRRLYGGCMLPIAGHAVLDADQIHVQGLVARVDGSEILRASHSGPAADAEPVGLAVADDLLAQGADRILAELVDDVAR
ncbi:hydroxymethylbilane synthase [Methylohalomonas lacus]|uniref:Porphobilinogen deaminase n=1 Tax=Methylohalomonas lacus TaxID=398773 RepID=A0AAE3L0Y0_9GAMM|nr:hydroxymethylbilane synthase [Methylohalomonas lacus]MCS3903234.1 hydroxymethylbilane synthase [Methylohalomonas lacus]